MWKRFDRALGVVVGLTLALVACQPPEEEQPQSSEGEAQVVVRGLSAYNIDRMVITAQPANVSRTLDYNADAGVFSGRLLLPAGEQTLTAEGYSSSYVPDGGSTDAGWPDGGSTDAGWSDAGWSDGGSAMDAGSMDGGATSGGTLVASGSATVTIVAGGSTSVTLRIYDLTPSPSQGDIGPLIRSVTASGTEVTVGNSISLKVDAVDLDGDALSYSWSSSCPTSTFSSPWSSSTRWSNSSPGVCRISVTVSSRWQSTTESLEVTTFSAPVDGGPGEGSVQVTGEYVARPSIYSINFSGPGVPNTSVYRSGSSATLPSAQAGMAYTVDMWMDFGTRFGTFEARLHSTCGGTLKKMWDSCASGGYCSATYNWTTPTSGVACKLTAEALNGHLVDSFAVGVAVR
ncbi:hypothetical protein [Archangium sp.]|uniref:hypothetical protein n=1 Tax=Archangium sp. TaxID=1872627 RepID=UPI002EDA19D7